MPGIAIIILPCFIAATVVRVVIDAEFARLEWTETVTSAKLIGRMEEVRWSAGEFAMGRPTELWFEKHNHHRIVTVNVRRTALLGDSIDYALVLLQPVQ